MSVALSSSAALSVRSLRPRQSVIHASRHVVTLASRFLKRRARQITSSKPDRMLALTISTLAFSGPAARGPARALVRMSDAAPVAPPPPPPPPLKMSASVPFLVENAKLAGLPAGVGFDPLGLSNGPLPIEWMQEAEIKHGRVCMLAVVGMLVPQVVTLPVRCTPRAPRDRESARRSPSAARGRSAALLVALAWAHAVRHLCEPVLATHHPTDARARGRRCRALRPARLAALRAGPRLLRRCGARRRRRVRCNVPDPLLGRCARWA
mgnify:CR=1 FL=1